MNLITGKHISRREVLRGLGATVALPFLATISNLDEVLTALK